MAEVRRFDEETMDFAKYTVRGGMRETSYNDLNSCIKRVENLRKQGKVINYIHRHDNGTYDILMSDPSFVEGNEVHCKFATPGYQEWEVRQYPNGKARIYNTYRRNLPYRFI